MLTTQLKNQNPLDPLDTNQFTQQLVAFAQVEQQLKSNNRSRRWSRCSRPRRRPPRCLVGATVVVNGATAQLANGSATWTLTGTKPATATISIADFDRPDRLYRQIRGQRRRADLHLGRPGNDGKLWPDGDYTLTATAVDASGQSTTLSTQVQAQVDSVDLTQSPPLLSIAGQNYR